MLLFNNISMSFQEACVHLLHLARRNKWNKTHLALLHSFSFTARVLYSLVVSELQWNSELKPTNYTQRDFWELLCPIQQDALAELLFAPVQAPMSLMLLELSLTASSRFNREPLVEHYMDKASRYFSSLLWTFLTWFRESVFFFVSHDERQQRMWSLIP